MRAPRLFRSTLMSAALVAASLGTASPAHAVVVCPTVVETVDSESNPLGYGTLSPSPAPGTNWSGCDLSLAELGMAYTDSDFSGVNLTGATFSVDATAKFTSDWGFNAFDFAESTLDDATFQCYVDPTTAGIAFDGSPYENSNMANADFSGASVVGAAFNGCDMNSIIVATGAGAVADFSDATFTGAYDEWDDQYLGLITYSDLTGATFDGATFSMVSVTSNTWDAASFKNAVFESPSSPYGGWVYQTVGNNVLSEGFDPSSSFGPDFSGAHFTNIDVYGNDLRKSNLEYMHVTSDDRNAGTASFAFNDLTGAGLLGLSLNFVLVALDLSDAGMVQGLSLADSAVTASDFSRSILDGLDLTNTYFWADCAQCMSAQRMAASVQGPMTYYYGGGANFADATLNSAILTAVSNVPGTGDSAAMLNFDGAQMRNTTWENAYIRDASFNDVDLHESQFRKADLGNVYFTVSDLGYNDFTGAMFSGHVDFSGSDLTGASFTGSFGPAVFDSYWYEPLYWGGSPGGPVFTGANLEGTNFTGVTLNGAKSGGVVGTPLLDSSYLLTTAGTGVGQSTDVAKQGFIVGPGVNLTDVDLSGMNLTGVDLAGSVLSGTNLSNTTLAGTSLNGYLSRQGSSFVFGLNLTNADMSGADLRYYGFSADNNITLDGANLTNANLLGATFQGATSTGVDFTGAELSYADLDRATWNSTILTGASLHWTDVTRWTLSTDDTKLAGVESSHLVGAPTALPTNWSVNRKVLVGPGANASYTSLFGQDFEGRNLSGLRARYSDLTDSDFDLANLTGAKLDFADLEGSTFASATLTDISAAGANAPGVTFGTPAAIPSFAAQYGGSIRLASAMSGATMRGANLKGATFTDVNLSGADFSGANLKDAQFSATSLAGADLSGANLQGVSFSGTNLSGADLSGADLAGADLKGANLSGAHLGNANLSGVDLTGVDLRGVDTTGVTWGTAKCNDGLVASVHAGGKCPVAAPPGTRAQTKFSLPKTLKRGKTLKLAAKTRQGVTVTVRASGKCSVSKTTAKVRGKRVVTGYLVKAKTAKGTCTVTILSSPSSTYATLFQQKSIRVV